LVKVIVRQADFHDPGGVKEQFQDTVNNVYCSHKSSSLQLCLSFYKRFISIKKKKK